jgi:transcriptional regulator with PAS, ATPase and Fis domain
MDLRTLINEGKFRDDLYYRIAKAVIQVPALRDRREDIPVYLDHFLDKINQSFNTQIRRISKKALDLLINYPWPGNVRELINVLEQSVLAALNEKEITQTHLPQDIVQRSRGILGKSLREDTNSIQDAVMRTEKELMLSALTDAGGNKRKAARSINMPRSTFYQKLRAYGIGPKV